MQRMINLIKAICLSLDDQKYRRRLIVRAIEDAVVVLWLCLMIAGGCKIATQVFRLLGVE